MDLTGQKFGRLILTERIVNKHRVKYRCICECGNETLVKSDNLTNGHTQSCGCLNFEINFKHGYSRQRIYRTWISMKERCYNEKSTNYEYYGARGIKVCDRWLESFENFLIDVGEPPSIDHSIDRIDNEGHYEPDNVKWSTALEQANNRR